MVEQRGRTLARQAGLHGELALVERAGDYEIVSNGTFLADTRDGRSERLLVRVALDALPRSGPHRLLLGGLGVGFSLAEALASQEVGEVVVVECEPAVVDWNRRFTRARTGGHVDDGRVCCEVADLVKWVRRPHVATFDAICLDVDNGPGWVVGPGNAWLYGDDGLATLHDLLAPGGVLSVWSSADADGFEQTLARHYRGVRRLEVPARRGPPDVIYLARR